MQSVSKSMTIVGTDLHVDAVFKGAVLGSEPADPVAYDCFKEQTNTNGTIMVDDAGVITEPAENLEDCYLVYNGKSWVGWDGTGPLVAVIHEP